MGPQELAPTAHPIAVSTDCTSAEEPVPTELLPEPDGASAAAGPAAVTSPAVMARAAAPVRNARPMRVMSGIVRSIKPVPIAPESWGIGTFDSKRASSFVTSQ